MIYHVPKSTALPPYAAKYSYNSLRLIKMMLCCWTSHHWGSTEFKETQGTFLVRCISSVEGCKEIKLKMNM